MWRWKRLKEPTHQIKTVKHWENEQTQSTLHNMKEALFPWFLFFFVFLCVFVPYFIKIHLGQNINGLSWFSRLLFMLLITDIRYRRRRHNFRLICVVCIYTGDSTTVIAVSWVWLWKKSKRFQAHTQITSNMTKILSSFKLDVLCRCNNKSSELRAQFQAY